MPQPYTKKLAITGNTSMPVINNRGDLNKSPPIENMETIKCITWNIKLNKNNQTVLALLDSDSETNLIS